MNFASEYVLSKIRNLNEKNKESFFQPDTNVISATFDHLVDSPNTHAGEAILCSKCSAVLSKHSKLADLNDDKKKLWICEFCNYENKILIHLDEIPSQEEITYLLESNNQTLATNNSFDSTYVVYCIDISGSMSVTTPVNASLNLPTDRRRDERFRNVAGEDFVPNFRSNIKHLTRLEAVQIAIDDNLNKLEKNSPEKKIGIVTFNHLVSVIGDGKINKIDIEGDKLESTNEIKNYVEQTPELDSLSNCKNILRKKLFDLEEGGATALGPALYYSVLLASKKQGSQVILCTDGLANKGIGSLENDNQEEINKFYEEISELALTKGVSVSIITIEGTSCKLGLLGEISSKTGGLVNVVNPLNLKEQFSNILEDQIIATNVFAELILTKELYIKDHENFDNRQSKIDKQIGNVTRETELTFEFAVRDDMEIKSKQLPFQLKIFYNNLNGAKFLRVLTKIKQLTDNQDLAEESCNRAILAVNAIQTQEKILHRYPERANLNHYSEYVKNVRTKKNDSFSPAAYSLQQAELTQTIISNSSVLELDNGSFYRRLNDRDASRLYNFKKINAKNFSNNNQQKDDK